VSTLTRPRQVDVNLRSGPQMREYVAIADRVAGERPGRVLDWGCGHGQISHLLRQRGVDVVASITSREGNQRLFHWSTSPRSRRT
jgi:2-polyprenyl-3-methyl-5-hydroxy-6-metoxy-1,4-benzoquinol methylase